MILKNYCQPCRDQGVLCHAMSLHGWVPLIKRLTRKFRFFRYTPSCTVPHSTSAIWLSLSNLSKVYLFTLNSWMRFNYILWNFPKTSNNTDIFYSPTLLFQTIGIWDFGYSYALVRTCRFLLNREQ